MFIVMTMVFIRLRSWSKNEYTGKLLEEFFNMVNNKDKDVNINAVGKWTKVGVAAKTVKGNMYISIVVQVNPKA